MKTPPPEMHRAAFLSPDRAYRYWLRRKWSETKPGVVFVGLNPSTADEHDDDPTIRRCVAYARSWGYGSLVMANLFAFRATQPADLKRADDPVGAPNDGWLKLAAQEARLVVCCWGEGGAYLNRGQVVAQQLRQVASLHALALNASGQPAHPLYPRASLSARPWPAQEVNQ